MAMITIYHLDFAPPHR